MDLVEECSKELGKALVKMLTEHGIKHFRATTWPRWRSDFTADPWGASQRHASNVFLMLCAVAAAARLLALSLGSQLWPLLGVATFVLYALVAR